MREERRHEHEVALRVGPQNTPWTRIWFGKASNPPGFRSLPHHHGEAETGAYVLSGRARIYFGDGLKQFVDLSAGHQFQPAGLAGVAPS